MAGRKRDRLVQKEQLCPTAASHHVVPASLADRLGAQAKAGGVERYLRSANMG